MDVIEVEASPNSSGVDNTYSGDATFLYSSKITGNVNLEGVCEILAESGAFSFALTNRGRIFFTDAENLKSQQLNIQHEISEQGLKVTGHNDFLFTNPGNSNTYALLTAFNLILSDKHMFNSAYGFPTESARIFMRPIALRFEGDEAYEFVTPYIRVYVGGIVSIALSSLPGFVDASISTVVHDEVNKSRRNIESVLCEKELHQACTESQLSQMSRAERLRQRKPFELIITSALANPEAIEFLEEQLEVFELVHTDQFTISDLARNLLFVVARTIKLGAVQTKINWYAGRYEDESIGHHWRGKPLIYIQSHSQQKWSASENSALHSQLIKSVMTRSQISNANDFVNPVARDMRQSDDYNNFYSEAVSLLFSSAQVEKFIKGQSHYTFQNLTSDIQVLNEAAEYILIYYSYAGLNLKKCSTAIHVAQLELDILEFEETLLQAHKYGEVAKYIEEVQVGGQLSTTYKQLQKKIETVRKSLELQEKIVSESNMRRLTIIFGIIASATLPPELMQPLLKYLGLISTDESLNKFYSIAASLASVICVLMLAHVAFKIGAQKIKILIRR
ncbi:hypothetical protein [Pseudomonas fluorescens]|uniref:Uncharacterized protein n=1 Tax=Pseudomonas fluorescens TaxID=294 RepID=A0A109KE72_PSEFL|nr:hypothetical protein [Pseudomonas fluorescens]KWV67627.1 hypothetical protein PFL603g_06498 [Pseudomonas fluorescens]